MSLPLAARMRPTKIEEFVGQHHLVGFNKILYRAIKADRISSCIFYGPPGTGKTTLAQVISHETNYPYRSLSAVTAGVKEIRALAIEAENRLLNPKGKIILFFDEIHHLNKAQQDVLLPFVEQGLIILIGATTANPYFDVNKALLSRVSIYKFESLTNSDIETILKRCLTDEKKGLGQFNMSINDDALQYLARACSGDARIAMNALELAVLTTDPNNEGVIEIELSIVSECIGQNMLKYDKDGDEHYDLISAFIKSMRNYMEPDAVLHYLARLIESGEKPEFIARRIMIAASEELGLASPQVLQLTVAATLAVERVGWPEARIILAQAALAVACSQKSNAVYLGVEKAIEDVRSGKVGAIPIHLRDSSYSGAKKFGHGVEYKYSHDYPDARSLQPFLPSELKGVRYYIPKDSGSESKIKTKLDEIRKEC